MQGRESACLTFRGIKQLSVSTHFQHVKVIMLWLNSSKNLFSAATNFLLGYMSDWRKKEKEAVYIVQIRTQFKRVGMLMRKEDFSTTQLQGRKNVYPLENPMTGCMCSREAVRDTTRHARCIEVFVVILNITENNSMEKHRSPWLRWKLKI